MPFLALRGAFLNAMEAAAFLATTPVDLLFADIQMPGLTGLQLVQSLTRRPMVIFITAYKNFAIDGFEHDAVDYLLKPVSFERFLKAVNKAHELYQLRQKSHFAPVLEEKASESDHIFVYSEYSLVRVNFDEVTYVEGLKDYVKIHFDPPQKPLLTRQSLKGMEELLPPTRFWRVHKSFIIHKNKIQAIRRGALQVGAAEIPVGESYREELSRRLPEWKG